MSGAMDCGDGGCKIMPGETLCDEVEPSAAFQCKFSSSFKSDLGPTVNCSSSPKTELGSEEYSVYKAADLLRSFHLNEVVNVRECTNGSEDYSKCKTVCNCAMAAQETDPTECCSCTHRSSADTALISNETDVNIDARVLENDHMSLMKNVQQTGKTENGATHPISDSVPATTKRCRHATTDSSGSVHDYVASGHDVVFSGGIEYRPYGCERHLCDIMELVSRDLSEPYSVYTYRYFIYNWPNLCFRVSKQ